MLLVICKHAMQRLCLHAQSNGLAGNGNKVGLHMMYSSPPAHLEHTLRLVGKHGEQPSPTSASMQREGILLMYLSHTDSAYMFWKFMQHALGKVPLSGMG